MSTEFFTGNWWKQIGDALRAGKAFDSLILSLKRALQGEVSNSDIPAYDEYVGIVRPHAWEDESADPRTPPYTLDGPLWVPGNSFDQALNEFSALYAAHTSYCTQMIVHASTLAEGMIIHFLTVFFENRTEQMYDFTGHEGLKGRISLKVIAASKSLQDLMHSLASQAANRVFQQPYPKMLKTLEQLPGIELSPEHLREDLSEIFKVRNSIVHGEHSHPLSMSEARTALWTIGKLREHLVHVAMMNELPVSEEEFSEEERKTRRVELTWDHEGEWPGDMQWHPHPRDTLRPEIFVRFGRDITEFVPYDEGTHRESEGNLLQCAHEYLKEAYDLYTDTRTVELRYPLGFHFRSFSREQLRAIDDGSMPFPPEPTCEDDEE